MNNYTFIGSLENGKSIFMDENKAFAIEHDHRHLDEIYQHQSRPTAFRPQITDHNTNLHTSNKPGMQKSH